MRYQATVSGDTVARDRAYRQDQQQHLQRLGARSLYRKQAHLEKQLLCQPLNCLLGFPYPHSRTWTFSNGGKGHLVFTDGHGLFAVIVDQYTKTQNRNTEPLSLQASHQGQTFARRGPTHAVVLAGAFIEQHDNVHWTPLQHQLLTRVRLLVNILEDLHCVNQRYPVNANVTPTRQFRSFNTHAPNVSEQRSATYTRSVPNITGQHSATYTQNAPNVGGQHSAAYTDVKETITTNEFWLTLIVVLCGLLFALVTSHGG